MSIEIKTVLNTKNSLVNLAREYYELNQKKKEIEKALKYLKQTISSSLKNENIHAIEQGKYRISLALVKSQRFNASKFKQEHPAMYEKYLTSVEYEKLTINLLEE